MSDTVTIYHNPRCSKSRQALELLEGEGVIPHVVKYLENPPNAATLNSLLDMLSLAPRDLMRKQEAEYTELKLDNPSLTREQLIEVMIAHPRLIERPIVIKDGQAIIGRPPEKVLDLL